MAKSYLCVEVKENHTDAKQGRCWSAKINIFEIGADGVLRYQGRLCVPDVDGLRDRILIEAHVSRYILFIPALLRSIMT